MAVSSERRDIQGIQTRVRRQRSRSNRLGRNTYDEHDVHGRHRARVPGHRWARLKTAAPYSQYIQGRMAGSSERRDIQWIHKTVRRQRSRSNRRAETRTLNMLAMVRHRARVPVTDGLVEGSGTLQQCIQGRMAVSSERRDIQDIHKTVRRQRSRSNRRAETRTSNMAYMVVTELVSQSPMGWLKRAAPYSSTSRDE